MIPPFFIDPTVRYRRAEPPAGMRVKRPRGAVRATITSGMSGAEYAPADTTLAAGGHRLCVPKRSAAMNTEQVANRLVELCRKGEYEQAQRELYAQDAVSIEMPGLPEGALGNVEGLGAIYEKGRQFSERVEAVHASE